MKIKAKIFWEDQESNEYFQGEYKFDKSYSFSLDLFSCFKIICLCANFMTILFS